MQYPRSFKGGRMITSKFRLPFTVRWGDQTLRPGEYSLFFLGIRPAPVVVIEGNGVSAILAPSPIGACERARLNALFLCPAVEPPQVQLLRLASTGIDLRFQEDAPRDAHLGVLALPLLNGVEAWKGTSSFC